MKRVLMSFVFAMLILLGVSPNQVYASTEGVNITHTKNSITVDWSDKANAEYESGYTYTAYRAEIYT